MKVAILTGDFPGIDRTKQERACLKKIETLGLNYSKTYSCVSEVVADIKNVNFLIVMSMRCIGDTRKQLEFKDDVMLRYPSLQILYIFEGGPFSGSALNDPINGSGHEMNLHIAMAASTNFGKIFPVALEIERLKT